MPSVPQIPSPRIRAGATALLVFAAAAVSASPALAAWSGPSPLPFSSSAFFTGTTSACVGGGRALIATDHEVLAGVQVGASAGLVPIDPVSGTIGEPEVLPGPSRRDQAAVGPLPGDQALVAATDGTILRIAVRTRGTGIGAWHEVPIPADLGPGFRQPYFHQASDGTTLILVSATAPTSHGPDVGGHLAVVRRPDGTYSDPLVVPGAYASVSVADGGRAVAADATYAPAPRSLRVSELQGRQWETRTVPDGPSPAAWDEFRVATNAAGQTVVVRTLARSAEGGTTETAIMLSRRTATGWTADAEVFAAAGLRLGPVSVTPAGSARVGYRRGSASEDRFGEVTVSPAGDVRRDELPALDPVAWGARGWATSVSEPFPVFAGGIGQRDPEGFLTRIEPRPTIDVYGGAIPAMCSAPTGSVLEVIAPDRGATDTLSASWRASGAARFGAAQQLDQGPTKELLGVATGPVRSLVVWRSAPDALGLATAPAGGEFEAATIGGAAGYPRAVVTRTGAAVVVVSGATGEPDQVWRNVPQAAEPPRQASPLERLRDRIQRQLRLLEARWRWLLARALR